MLLQSIGGIGPLVTEPKDIGSATSVLRGLYPPVARPLDQFLKVSESDSICFVETGNPQGLPVIYVHGGPGEQFYEDDLRWFDPEKYRIIACDQRGTGRSRPSCQDFSVNPTRFTNLSINDLAEDMEKLREHLQIDKWLVFGGSWGSTLSLYYGQEYPEKTVGLVLRGIFLATEEENRRFFDAESLQKNVPGWSQASLDTLLAYAKNSAITIDESHIESIVKAYFEMIVLRNDYSAMHLWCAYEDYVDNPSDKALQHLLQLPETEKDVDPAERACSIFETLFFSKLPETLNLLEETRIKKLRSLPVIIVQGAQDSECPPEYAEKLRDALVTNEIKTDFHLIATGKHSPYSQEMTDALITATDLFVKSNA